MAHGADYRRKADPFVTEIVCIGARRQ